MSIPYRTMSTTSKIIQNHSKSLQIIQNHVQITLKTMYKSLEITPNHSKITPNHYETMSTAYKTISTTHNDEYSFCLGYSCHMALTSNAVLCWAVGRACPWFVWGICCFVLGVAVHVCFYMCIVWICVQLKRIHVCGLLCFGTIVVGVWGAPFS